MQRKRVNTKYKLHSIPIINKLKSNVLYSTPCVFALLIVGIVSPAFLSRNCHAVTDGGNAAYFNGTASDASAISPITGDTPAPAPFVSLSLSKTSLSSDVATPGNTVTVTTNVTVEVDNVNSYSLTLTIDKANLTNGDTTIMAGDVNTDNTWGYRWDNDSDYTAPSTTAKTLTVPTLSNHSIKFTKPLTFAAKFASDANAGHYKANGTLSLVATPKTTTYVLDDLTQMQQLTLAPDACTNTPFLTGRTYSEEYTLMDVRDNNTYTIRKFGDGKCWMTSNLKLSNWLNDDYTFYTGGRRLIPATSDIAAEYILPASNKVGFSGDDIANVYRDPRETLEVAKNNGYYSWCAATAGTCMIDGVAISRKEASSSICPKGWKLPSKTDFENFMSMEGIYTYHSTTDTDLRLQGTKKIQGSPYIFSYTGIVSTSGSITDSNSGRWWSRVAELADRAEYLIVADADVYMGVADRQYGMVVRCVSQ